MAKTYKTPLEQSQNLQKINPYIQDDYDWASAGYTSKEHYLTNNDALFNLDNLHQEKEKEYAANSDNFRNKKISLEEWLANIDALEEKYKPLIAEQVKRIK